jgi:hypothetical protein
MAMSSFLLSHVHLDQYRYSLYRSITCQGGVVVPKEYAYLCGYTLGNHEKSGCLSEDYEARVHSCEKGSGCEYRDEHGKDEAVVIIPVVTRIDGVEIREVGAGGGKGDLDSAQEVELPNMDAMDDLNVLCRKRIKDETNLQRVAKHIRSSYQSGRQRIVIDKHLQDGINDTKIDSFIDELVEMSKSIPEEESKEPQTASKSPPKTIKFPYSRHSSYSELCELVKAFQPRDVYPCTVDEEEMKAKFTQSLTSSFEMRSAIESQAVLSISQHDPQSEHELPAEAHFEDGEETEPDNKLGNEPSSKITNDSFTSGGPLPVTRKRSFVVESSPRPPKKQSINEWAYDAALGLDPDCSDWKQFGGLTSVRKNESQVSIELGMDD